MTEHPDHGERAHAPLSPSGGDRWINCPGSIRLTEGLPDTSSEFAEWGTQCHELGELALRARFHGEKVNFSQTKEHIDSETGEIRRVPKWDKEHFAAVSQYRDYIQDLINKHGQGETPVVIIERRVKFRRWVPGGFGTGDCILFFPQKKLVVVVDLKGGEGVLVFAENNSQLKFYAAGAMDLLEHICDVERVVLSICQPRRDHFDEWEIAAGELLSWLEEIRPVAEEAFAGSSRLVAGTHCQFCKAEARCPQRTRVALELFEQPALLGPERIAELLPKLPLIEAWAKKLQVYAFDQAVNHGVRFTGYKLVAGRATRRWSDPKRVAEVLIEDGLKPADIWEQKILGITDAEKLVGKKHRVFELAVKGEAKPALVPDSDKRAEWRSTAEVHADFDD